jgi:hypothetical protein
MKIAFRKIFLTAMLFMAMFNLVVIGQAEIDFSGQLAGWGGINLKQQYWLGGRYLPQIQLELPEKLNGFDFEASANLWAGVQWLNDSLHYSSEAEPYRFWGRYTTNRMELRLGLQKINFGSASMLRPLMWFDQLDPRDPLQLTDGVWALLGRYYFQNNSNIWLWLMYPSNKPKTWELFSSNQKIPEWGGRFQYPAASGEIAFSFHHRTATSLDNPYNLPIHERIGETRLALDGKWDIGAGIWFESAFMKQNKDIGNLSNQLLLCVGSDYTFGLGNGLHLLAENLIGLSGKEFTSMNQGFGFTALSVAYPFSMFDQFSLMTYFDWKSGSSYSFVQYQFKIKKIDVMCMAWINPDTYFIPGQSYDAQLYAGKGFQLMLVYHH